MHELRPPKRVTHQELLELLQVRRPLQLPLAHLRAHLIDEVSEVAVATPVLLLERSLVNITNLKAQLTFRKVAK